MEENITPTMCFFFGQKSLYLAFFAKNLMYMFNRFSKVFLLVLSAGLMILNVSCEEEADDLPSQTSPKDGGYYDITNIAVTERSDINGNGYYTHAKVTCDISVNSDAPDGYSETAYASLSLQSSGSSSGTTLAKTGNFSFSKGGGVTNIDFGTIDFHENVSDRNDYTLSVNIIQASSDRRILSRGFLGQIETVALDSTISFELQDVTWTNGVDSSGDGYYSSRSFSTSVVSLGQSGTVANVEYWLERRYFDENQNLFIEVVPLGTFDGYVIQRKGFGDVITDNVDANALGIIREEYDLGILALNPSNGDTLLLQVVTRDESKQLAFENTAYDFREYTINNVTVDSIVDMDGDGYARSQQFVFTVDGPTLDYDTVPGTMSPRVYLYYAGPATSGELEVYTFQEVTPGTPSADVRFQVEDLDSGLYNFEIWINEPAGNVVVSTGSTGLNVQLYNNGDFAELGDVMLEKDDED